MKLVPRNNNLGFSLFDNMFDDMFRDPFFTNSNNTKLMKTDIQEKDNNYILDMDLPGYEKEDIKAQLKDGYLTITAQKNTSNDDKDEKGNYIRRERYCGKCSRSFYVGDGIKEEDIDIISPLDVYVSHANLIIHPYLGLIKNTDNLNLNESEVDHVFLVPLNYLLDYDVTCYTNDVKVIPKDDFPYNKIPNKAITKTFPIFPIFFSHIFNMSL